MLILGLDIGTTTVSAVVTDGKRVLASKTLKNESFLSNCPTWERAQDAQKIKEIASRAVYELLSAYPAVARIGVTGQQHGIVYLDAAGNAVSPLYTWQDGRGDLPFDETHSYAAHLSALTDYSLASGYGMVTHFYNLENGLVPKSAASFCTIHDYLAMLLSGRTQPCIDASDAASFGFFDLENNCFDLTAVQKAGIDPVLLPEIAKQPCLGSGTLGIPVFVAIGDNQASFLGATDGENGAMLVNIGTGSQFSVHAERLTRCAGLETRPFPTGGCLLVGSSLCGGRAYALIEQFFRKTAELVTGTVQDVCYDAMARALQNNAEPNEVLTFLPLFQGTRENPALRGSILGIGTENFEPLSLLYALLHGMTDELFGLYECYRRAGGKSGKLYGSGNGLRKNPTLCCLFEKTFAQMLTLSQNEEEAAYGAALFAESCNI